MYLLIINLDLPPSPLSSLATCSLLHPPARKMVETHMPAPGEETLILMCGPPPMLKFACLPALEALGYSEEMQFAFWYPPLRPPPPAIKTVHPESDAYLLRLIVSPPPSPHPSSRTSRKLFFFTCLVREKIAWGYVISRGVCYRDLLLRHLW